MIKNYSLNKLVQSTHILHFLDVINKKNNMFLVLSSALTRVLNNFIIK